MLDIQFIREHPEVVKESQRKRGESVELVDEVLRADEERRSSLKQFEEARARNLRQLNLVIPEKLHSRVVYTRAEALPFFNINFPGELEQARRMAEAAREQRHSTACHASEEGIR